MGCRVEPSVVVLGGLAAYNVVQNVFLPEGAYVPANLLATGSLIAYARSVGASPAEIGLAPDRLCAGLRLGGGLAAAVAAGVAGTSRSERAARWFRDERARGHGRGEASYRVVLRFPLGTALFEEVAFRGVLDGLWRRSHGDGSARIVTAVAFGAWHLLPTFRLYEGMGFGSDGSRVGERAGAAVGGMFATTIAGFGFTALRERSASVAAPWLVHAAFNTLGYLAARRAWKLAEAGA